MYPFSLNYRREHILAEILWQQPLGVLTQGIWYADRAVQDCQHCVQPGQGLQVPRLPLTQVGSTASFLRASVCPTPYRLFSLSFLPHTLFLFPLPFVLYCNSVADSLFALLFSFRLFFHFTSFLSFSFLSYSNSITISVSLLLPAVYIAIAFCAWFFFLTRYFSVCLFLLYILSLCFSYWLFSAEDICGSSLSPLWTFSDSFFFILPWQYYDTVSLLTI